MKKIVYSILILLSINIGLFTIIMYKKFQISKDFSYDYFYLASRKRSELTTQCELQPINPHFYIGKDTSNTVHISSFLSRKYALCFYFPRHTCPPCLDNIHSLIKNIFPNYQERTDIIFISNDLEYRLRENFYGKKILWNKNKKLGVMFEKITTPTFFIIDKDLQTKCVFITDKMIPEYIEDYLKIIKQRFLPI